jgi:hypothetical protein
VPPILPPGAQIAVVSGDATMPGLTIVELLRPDAYRMPPHSHRVDEFVEMQEGTITCVHAWRAPRRAAFPYGN